MLSTLQGGISKAVRTAGQALERFGQTLETNAHVDKLQPSLRVIKLGANAPAVGSGAFVAPTASVIGQVKLGASSSVWYGAVVRGDVNTITIGEGSSIGDRAMVHCSGISTNKPTVIGNRVVVGAGAIVHGCTLEDESLVGEGAQVLDGAKISKHAMVAPGAVVGQGKVVASGQLWGGIPAAYLRDLTEKEKAAIKAPAEENVTLAAKHSEEVEKTWQQVELEEDDHEQVSQRNPYYYTRLSLKQASYKLGEIEGHQVPGRILDTPVSGR